MLIVAVGATATDVLQASRSAADAGYSVRVVDPRWVSPVNPELIALARQSRLVVTVEDGIVAGGVGSRVSQALRMAGVNVPGREIGIPAEFLTHGKIADVRAKVGLTAADIGRRIVEWSALVQVEPVTDTESPDSVQDDVSAMLHRDDLDAN